MQRESILLVGDQKEHYHKLRSELRGTCYRLLRARNLRVAKWLMERVKISLMVVAPDSAAPDAAVESASRFVSTVSQRPGASAQSEADCAMARPMLLISRQEQAEPSWCGSLLDEPLGSAEESDAETRNDTGVLLEAGAAGIPVLYIVPSYGMGFAPRPETELAAAINRGADYILFAPYEQADLIQAIRTAMLNGPARGAQEKSSRPIEIALRDRMCTLHASREQLSRLFIGAAEQLEHARTRVSWCESEIRGLRQARVRQELESQFQQEGLPEVVRGVAHDFTNLLEAAGTTATSLYGQSHSPAMYRRAMQAVMDQAQELIDCLQDLTRPASWAWRTEPVDLDEIVNGTLQAALVPLREPRIRVRVRMGGLEPVWAHRSLVYRALLNLIWNAVQAMPNGGLLSILGYVRGNRVVIEVGDTGEGIAAQDREKVLQESCTTKPGHRGMGLTLVRELIEKCGGEITFSSRPKRGSLFSIALPVAMQTEAEATGIREMSAPVGAGRAGAESGGKSPLQVLELRPAESAAAPHPARIARMKRSNNSKPAATGAPHQKHGDVVLQP